MVVNCLNYLNYFILPIRTVEPWLDATTSFSTPQHLNSSTPQLLNYLNYQQPSTVEP